MQHRGRYRISTNNGIDSKGLVRESYHFHMERRFKVKKEDFRRVLKGK